MPLTPTEKIEILNSMLESITFNSSLGFCGAYRIAVQPSAKFSARPPIELIMLEAIPELLEYKPSEVDNRASSFWFWFPNDSKGRLIRLSIIEELLIKLNN